MGAKRVQKYRKRIQQSRADYGKSKKPKMTNVERQSVYRQRLKCKAAEHRKRVQPARNRVHLSLLMIVWEWTTRKT